MIDGSRIVKSPWGPQFSHRLGIAESGHIDLTATAFDHFGIYHLEADTLRLCIVPPQLSSAYNDGRIRTRRHGRPSSTQRQGCCSC